MKKACPPPASLRAYGFSLILFLASAAGLLAELSCGPLFSSHMVLQRDRPIPIWGKANPGETITVEFAAQQQTTRAAADGTWSLRLEPMPASAEPRPLTVRGSDTLRFEDVLVGEVWLCSGQSNMEKPLGLRAGQTPTDHWTEEIKAAQYPLIRIFQWPRGREAQAANYVRSWYPCTPESIDQSHFSAAGYFFARELQGALKVPVGMIHSSVGGTRIESWTPAEAFDAFPSLKDYALAARSGAKISNTTASNLYRSMIEPFAPYALRGFLWYQGESNLINGDTDIYTEKMRALIQGWRAAWGREELPFYFVQLAPYQYTARKAQPLFTSEALPAFWEAQEKALGIPHTGLVTITDTVTNYRDIHPTDKKTVGERLALVALAKTYSMNAEMSGPTFKTTERQDASLWITFDHAKGLRCRDGKPVRGFEIAGEDQVFSPATAEIVGEKLRVSAPSVPRPVAARFAWSETPSSNLENAAGLPARPFRTDAWQLKTTREPTPEEALLFKRAESIRTPAPSLVPRINGPKVLGAKAGNPFVYRIPTTGERPLRWVVEKIPAGLSLDADKGILSGTTPAPGKYTLSIIATNARGSGKGEIVLRVDEGLCLTPPMGWNNYNAFRMRIDDKLIRSAAEALISSGLADHGYNYVNIDDGWQGKRDAKGQIQGSGKFPDMKALGAHIHGLGLRFGLYSSPGPRTCAGFEGSYQHEAEDARTYAAWGVDYLKYDYCFYDSIGQELLGRRMAEHLPAEAERLKALVAERIPLTEVRPRNPETNARIKDLSTQIEALYNKVDPAKRKAIEVEIYRAPYSLMGEHLARAERDIVYSLCQYGMGEVQTWGPSVKAHTWRTTRDITPRWSAVTSIVDKQPGLERFAGPGRWNDPDMLEVGNGELNPEEMHAHMTWWAMLSAPLLVGTDVSKADPLTLSVLGNDEVIAVNQDPLGQQGRRIQKDGTSELWTKALADGRLAVALFNRGESPLPMTVEPAQLGLGTFASVRDLWRQKALRVTDSKIEILVAPHSAELLSVDGKP